MKTFTIDQDNNITAHPTPREAKSVVDAERFATAAALQKLASNWPAARLVEIWNSLPGATPVKKFKDRETAVLRIWNAIQSLGEAAPAKVAQPADRSVAPAAPQTPGKAGAVSPRKTTAKATKKPPTVETKKSTKTETIIGLLKRPTGANLQEIMQATNWQAHSVRGFISGTLAKKMSLQVVSAKSAGGPRIYSIEA